MATTTIYYGIVHETSQFSFEEPQQVFKKYIKDYPTNDLHSCPAIQDYYKNVFSVKLNKEFNIRKLDEGISVNQNETFYKKNILLRDEKGLLGFNQSFFFVSQDDDLQISQMHPVLENTDISNKTITIEGTFNLGKWIRPLQYNFWIKENSEISFKPDDSIFYVKFHTQNKIKFKKFYITNELSNLLQQGSSLRKDCPYSKVKPLSYFYDIFSKHKNYKKTVLKQIKNNLME